MIELERSNRRAESGQALFAGVTLMLISSLVVLFFLSVVESAQKQAERNQAHRQFLLQKGNETAQILNEISHNNRMILLALQVVSKAHLESLSWGFALSSLRPAADNVMFLSAEQAHFSRKDVPKNLVQTLFSAFSRKSERGFFLASGYARRNKELVTILKKGSNKNLSSLLYVSSSADAFCAAVHLNSRSSSFVLPVKNCSVHSLTMSLILSYDREISSWEKRNSKASFGVTIFDWQQQTQDFIRSLVLEKSVFDPPKTPQSAVQTLLEKFGLIESRGVTPESYHPVIAVTHRFLQSTSEACQSSNTYHALLSIKDWSQPAPCQVSGGQALKALFVPAWAPVLIHH